MNFNKLYLSLNVFYLVFGAASIFFSLDLYLFLSLLYGTHVYCFAAIQAMFFLMK